MSFFLDENLPKQLAAGMKAFGEDVAHTTEQWPAGTKDVELLEAIGGLNGFLITRDRRIRFNPAERQALKANGVGAFFLGGKDLNFCKMVQVLVKSWPEIKRHAAKEQRPFAFRLRPNGGKLERLKL